MSQTKTLSNSKEQRETKDWTLMFYFASDNPLAPGIISQLKSIKDAGFHPDANVIALFDPHGSVTPTHVFEVNAIRKLKARGRSQVGPPANDPYVGNLVLDKLWGDETILSPVEGTGRVQEVPISAYIAQDLKEQKPESGENGRERSGDAAFGLDERADDPDDIDDVDDDADGQDWATPIEYNPPTLPNELKRESNPAQALKNFLGFCAKSYPARHYILFIVGHGLVVGNDLFLYDENVSDTVQPPPPEKSQNGQRQSNSTGGTLRSSPALLLTEFREALEEFSNKRTVGELELVSFHSCSMSSLEVAYEIRKHAKYMLASQGPAFVGSYPYRQIVMRLFNELNCDLWATDFKNKAVTLVDALKAQTGPTYGLFKSWMERTDGDLTDIRAGLDRHVAGQTPGKKLLLGLVGAFNHILSDPLMYEGEYFKDDALREERRLLEKKRSPYARLSKGDVMRLNRRLFAAACPGIIEEKPERDVRGLFKSIFSYCLYNSFDYQLAGYSFDISLCDLSSIDRLEESLRGLTEALIAGLESKDRTVQGLILLAHWDAQSFWQESYTDLYDFCLRLYTRCREISPATEEMKTIVKNIKSACFVMMKSMRSGRKDSTLPSVEIAVKQDPDLEGVQQKLGKEYGKVIVNSDFTGPAYQYSHGLSIYFPWAEPVASPLWRDQYHTYQLNHDMRMNGKSWRCFLKKYFDATMRETRVDEESTAPKLTGDRLLLETIAAQIFAERGQLGKVGPNDPMGGSKSGGNDPTGSDCDCPTIKNYPTVSRLRRQVAERTAAGLAADQCEEPRKTADPKPAEQYNMPVGQGLKRLKP